MDLTPYFQQVLLTLVLAAVGVICTVIVKGGKLAETYVASKIGNDNTNALKAFAEMTVRSLRQSPAFKNLDSQAIKERAMAEITQYATAHNLPVDSTYIDRLIEASVQEMKSDLGEFDWVDPMSDADMEKTAANEAQALLKAAGVTIDAGLLETVIANSMEIFQGNMKKV